MSVPIMPRVIRNGRLRAPAPSRASRPVSEYSSKSIARLCTPRRKPWHSPKRSIETIGPQNRDMHRFHESQSRPIPATTDVIVRSRLPGRISSRTIVIGIPCVPMLWIATWSPSWISPAASAALITLSVMS